jgi:hypothetical protein
MNKARIKQNGTMNSALSTKYTNIDGLIGIGGLVGFEPTSLA